MDEDASQFKIQHCPEHIVIDEAGTRSEGHYSYPGRPAGNAGNGKHRYTMKAMLNLQESADAIVAKKLL